MMASAGIGDTITGSLLRAGARLAAAAAAARRG